MTFLFHLFIALCFILFQTVVIVQLPFLSHFYDTLIVLVLYLGFFHSFGSSLAVVTALGIVMDSQAGGPFGVYLTTYFWIFICAGWLKHFLHAGSVGLMLVLTVIGVLFENFIFALTLSIMTSGNQAFSTLPKFVSVQVVWAVATAPFIHFMIRWVYSRWNRWVAVFAGRIREHGGGGV